MRATTHHGRVKSSAHNDRKFDIEKADNINEELTEKNKYFCCYKGMSFEDAEKRFYEEHFKTALEKTNENYIKNGHRERVKSIDDLLTAKRTMPEETVLQVGSVKDGTVSGQQLASIYVEYQKQLLKWSKEHGEPFKVLNSALHVDEAVPHIHERRVWTYTDDKGVEHINMSKALEKADVPLPDPDKEPGRYNNRKMTFDSMCREMWLDICRNRGIEVESVAIPDIRHNMGKYEALQEQATMLQDDVLNAKIEKKCLRQDISTLKEEKALLEEKTKDLSCVVSDIEAKREQLSDLEHAIKLKELNYGSDLTDMIEITNLQNQAEKYQKLLQEYPELKHEHTQEVEHTHSYHMHF